MKINIKCVLNLMPSGGLRQVVAFQESACYESLVKVSDESISCWF